MEVYTNTCVLPESFMNIIAEHLDDQNVLSNMKILQKKNLHLVSAACWPWMVNDEFTKDKICPCCDPIFYKDMIGTEYRECKNLGLFRFFSKSVLCDKTKIEMAQNQRTLLRKFAIAKVIADTPEYKASEADIRASNPAIELEGPWCPALCVGGSRRSNSGVKWTPEMRPSCCMYDSIPCKNGYCKDHMHGDKFVHKFPIRNKCSGINPEKNYSSIFASFVEDISVIPIQMYTKPVMIEAVGIPIAEIENPTLWSSMIEKG
jgi:hypothetical protein